MQFPLTTQGPVVVKPAKPSKVNIRPAGSAENDGPCWSAVVGISRVTGLPAYGLRLRLRLRLAGGVGGSVP